MHIFPGYPSYPPIANPVSMKHKFERDRSFKLPEGPSRDDDDHHRKKRV